MTTTLKTVTTGDVDVVKVLQLNGVDDLAAVDSVEAHVWYRRDDVTTLAATVSDTANRYVSVQLGSTGGWLPTLVIPGRGERKYNLDVEVTFTDGSVLTWSTAVLPVRGQGA